MQYGLVDILTDRYLSVSDSHMRGPVFKPGISVLGLKGSYPSKCWGHLETSGDNTVFDSWKPWFIWLLSFSLDFGLSRSLSAAAAGDWGSDWSLGGAFFISSVEDSVVSPFDGLGKKSSVLILFFCIQPWQRINNIEHQTMCFQYMTQMLIGPPYPIRRHDIIGSCYPEHFCWHKYKVSSSLRSSIAFLIVAWRTRLKCKYTVGYINQQQRSLPNSGENWQFFNFVFFYIYFLRQDGARTYFFCAKTCKHAPLAQWPSLAWTLEDHPSSTRRG